MWVKIDVNLLGNFKTKRVAALLHIPKVQVVGHLTALWIWTLTSRPDGNLSKKDSAGHLRKLDEVDIALAAEWEGDPHEFVSALLSQQFIEQRGDFLYIHDWEDYSGSYLQTKESTRLRVAEWRARKRQQTPPPDPQRRTGVSETREEKYEAGAAPAADPPTGAMAAAADQLPGFETPTDTPAQANTRRKRKGYASESYWVAAEQGMGRKRPANQRGQDDWNRVLLDFEQARESPKTVKLAIWQYRTICPGYPLTIGAATREQWIAAIHDGTRPRDPSTLSPSQKGGQQRVPAAAPRIGGAAGTGTLTNNRATQDAARRLEARRRAEAEQHAPTPAAAAG